MRIPGRSRRRCSLHSSALRQGSSAFNLSNIQVTWARGRSSHAKATESEEIGTTATRSIIAYDGESFPPPFIYEQCGAPVTMYVASLFHSRQLTIFSPILILNSYGIMGWIRMKWSSKYQCSGSTSLGYTEISSGIDGGGQMRRLVLAKNQRLAQRRTHEYSRFMPPQHYYSR